jgi:hypothetical protein
VPCPHILLGAISTKDKSYAELISKRWRKELPHPNNNARIWLQKGPRIPLRRNKMKNKGSYRTI